MARNLSRIPFINTDPANLADAIVLINDRISEINRVYQEIEREINQQKGNDGTTPIFNNAPDMRRHRITNGERSKDPRDFIIRQELMDIGILGDPSGKVVFNSEVDFANVTTVSGPSGGTGIATGGFVEDAIDTALEAEVAKSQDGERLDIEDNDGQDGSSFGTAAMGRDGDGKARFLALTENGLKVDLSSIETLLLLLIQEIQELRNEH